jgi:signal transduction histidine kinase
MQAPDILGAKPASANRGSRAAPAKEPNPVPLELHAFLREKRDEIVRTWDAIPGRSAHEAGAASPLRDLLPELLVELSGWIERSSAAESGEGQRIAVARRAAERLNRPAQLTQLVEELSRLRATILRLRLGGRGGATEATVLELGRLNAAIDRAIRDATEQFLDARERWMEAGLAESEARYGALFDSIDEGYCVTEVLFDPAGKAIDYRFLEVNRAFERQTGLVNAAGRWMRELAPNHEEHWFERYGEVARTGEPTRFVNRAEALGRWYDTYAFRFGDPALRQVAILFNDITARYAAEEALREASRRKDEFLNMLSHELRNPLAPIRNSLYILERAGLNEAAARRAREVASRQVAHLTRLVDDLLDITRIARGKIELRRTHLDLAALVRRTCDDHRGLMEEHGIDLEAGTPAEPVWVNGDETRLVQVLGNLLHNAAKFTPAGGSVLASVTATGDSAIMHVRDTGTGIEPTLLDTVFEPFTQAEQALARSQGGLGLGLALVKGMVDAHGGSVSVTSAGQGRGAEFRIELPLVRIAAVAAAPPEPPTERATRRRRVLVVDDNLDSAETLAELVALFGHEPDVAHDGPSALAKARATRPDVVLCDIGLPGFSGYEVARQLRAGGLDSDSMKLIAVSGYVQPEDLARAAEAGFDAHVAKPLDPDEIETLLA